jgi:hypothetical protein
MRREGLATESDVGHDLTGSEADRILLAVDCLARTYPEGTGK